MSGRGRTGRVPGANVACGARALGDTNVGGVLSPALLAPRSAKLGSSLLELSFSTLPLAGLS